MNPLLTIGLVAIVCCGGVSCEGVGIGSPGPVSESVARGEYVAEPIATFGTLTTVFALPSRQDHWPTGELAGVGFQPDPDVDGAAIAPAKVLFFTDKVSLEERARIAKVLSPGHRAWVEAEDLGDIYAVTSINAIPFKNAEAIGSQAQATGLSFEVAEVGAWHNRMPPSGDRRHLFVNIRCTSALENDCEVRVVRVFYSFDKNLEGRPTEVPLRFIDRDTGMAGTKIAQEVKAGAVADLVVRGPGAYPAGHERQKIYLTVLFRVGEELVVLRGRGTIEVAM